MYYEIVKRIIDIFGSVFLLILFSPILLITSLIIKLTSKGPVLVEPGNAHMMRIGKNGKVFRLFKFRSMLVGSDDLITKDPKYKKHLSEWKNTNFKLINDPRVTPIGKFIRKYSIDEMPQLLNVLAGDMSIVGPRPYHSDELIEQQIKYPGTEGHVKQTQTVKPGITGFWQVSGRSEVNFDKRIEMDAYYAKKKSLLFDFLIMLKTPLVMISGKGAM